MTRLEQLAARLDERVGPSVVDDVRTIRSQLDEAADGDIHQLAENARKAAAEFRARFAGLARKPTQD